MRRRAVVLLLATLTTGALVLGSVGEVSASVSSAKAPVCKGKTKKKAIKAIKLAYDHWLNGTKYPDAETDKAPYLQYLSDPNLSQSFLDAFIASAAANASDAGNTSVVVHSVKCTGKKTAEVAYDLVLGGSEAPGIAPNPGLAVLEGKIWKVEGTTQCNLTALGDPSVQEPPHPCADILAGSPPSDV